MLPLCSLSAMLAIVFQPAFSVTYNCSSLYNKIPDNNDLKVVCGANVISLEVNLCSAQWAGFDPTTLALNGQRNTSQCLGLADTQVDPPVIRYQLPVNESQGNPCRQLYQIVDEVPDASGPFGSFSSVQAVVVTGYIDTPKSSSGIISYSTDLYYHFSCRYPLEYLLNNTKIVASSVSVATSDNNGTFINTLTMSVYNDSDYAFPLVAPPTGLALRSKVYVEVKSTNLTGNFNLLLDHCFATPTVYNQSNTEEFDFFAGCVVDAHTSVTVNGISKNSRFSFEAFRFVIHKNMDRSTIYLHCIIRLCEPSKCQEIIDGCHNKRRKRSMEALASEAGDSATVSVGPLYTGRSDTIPNALPLSSGRVPSGADMVKYKGLIIWIPFVTAARTLLV
ncbi:zona pellucida-like domain-containing protein 1 [Esox lucius]|nr:zona pellucida-like domain-containing protein 1 [Esox lucius]